MCVEKKKYIENPTERPYVYTPCYLKQSFIIGLRNGCNTYPVNVGQTSPVLLPFYTTVAFVLIHQTPHHLLRQSVSRNELVFPVDIEGVRSLLTFALYAP